MKYLLLKISALKLEPGEKAHFVLQANEFVPWSDLQSARDQRQYITANLSKGNESTPYALVCQSGYEINADDLSSAFAVESETAWEKDFKGYLYQNRIFYLKNVSYLPEVKANEWNDQGSGDKADVYRDYNTILAGPRWSVLRDFHNKWEELESSNNLSQEDLLPDHFPRIVGDNNAVFAERPHNPNREFENINIRNYVDVINQFRETTMRPEPKVHSVLPSLVEFKFSAVPFFSRPTPTSSTGYPSLAMSPSVAFWNPYNVPIDLGEVFVEVPMNVDMAWMNSREWDLLYNWFYHNPESLNTGFNLIPYHLTTSNTSYASKTFVNPGQHPYIDLNGNGRRDPGEPGSWIPNPRPPRRGGGGGTNSGPPWLPYIRENLLERDGKYNENN